MWGGKKGGGKKKQRGEKSNEGCGKEDRRRIEKRERRGRSGEGFDTRTDPLRHTHTSTHTHLNMHLLSHIR